MNRHRHTVAIRSTAAPEHGKYTRIRLFQLLQQVELIGHPAGTQVGAHPLVATVDTRKTSFGRTPCCGNGDVNSSDCPFHTTCGSPSPCSISPRSRRSYRISSSTTSSTSSSSISTLYFVSPLIVSK